MFMAEISVPGARSGIVAFFISRAAVPLLPIAAIFHMPQKVGQTEKPAKHSQIEELRGLWQRHSKKVPGGVWLVLTKSESALGIRDVG